MTEIFVAKAIVKLPKKNKSSSNVDTTSYSTTSTLQHHQDDTDYLVSDKLYFDGLSNITENEMMDLVRSCEPQKIVLNRKNDITFGGYIQFVDRDMADRAYTLLNGVSSRAGVRLQFKMNSPLGDCPEPEAQAGLLNIKNLPIHINNKSLYDLFRPFGPMILCKILVEQGSTFKGTALVQYFHSEDAKVAESSMNNKPVQDNIITVFPFVSSKTRVPSSSIIIDSEDLVTTRSSARYSISTPPSPLPPVVTDTTTTTTAHCSMATSPPIRSDGSSMVDFTNLYIKNLDLNVKSADLFNHFRKFGRIISARVMKNAQTKQSKGFGFVSFSKADEAQRAKQEMNGEFILSKPVIVAFHEPKKPRDNNNNNGASSPTESATFTTHYQQQRQSPPPPPMPSYSLMDNGNSLTNGPYYSQQQNTRTRDYTDYRYNNNNNNNNNLNQSASKYNNHSNHYQPQQPQQQPSQQDFNMSFPIHNKGFQSMERNNSRQSNIEIHDHSRQQQPQQIHIPPIATKHHDYNYHHNTPLRRNVLNSGSMNYPSTTSSLSKLASGGYINNAPYHHHQSVTQQQPLPPQHSQQQRPTFRRRGSVESIASVMTETSSQTRRYTITKAVLAIEKNDKHLHDIVDMLLTLKKKDLAICLFNKEFLKAKIKQAKDALDIFEEQKLQQHEKDYDEYHKDVYYKEQEQTVALPPTRYNNIVSIPPRSSRAIPIVAPPSSPLVKKPDTIIPKDKELSHEIEDFLSTLEGLTLHQKKQLLGDRLFPLVKSTGVKQAPRITIRLLDSVPLDELAYSMYDKDKLKHQVSRITSTTTTTSTG